MHPLTQYTLATQRIAEDQRRAQLERLARQARDGRVTHTDRAPFRDRLRLLIDRPRRYRTAIPLAAITLLAATAMPFGQASAADPANGPTSIDRPVAPLTVEGYPVPTPDAYFGRTRSSATGLAAPAAGAGPTFEAYQAVLLARHAQGLVPTFQQRQDFLMEEHGYAKTAVRRAGHVRTLPKSGPILTDANALALRRRQAFLMEEHGYTTGAR